MTDTDLLARRMAAFLLDAVVLFGVVSRAVRRRTESRAAAAVATIGVTAVAGLPYHVVFEGATGTTVGKRAVGVEVRDLDGDSPSVGAAAVRTVLRVVDWLPAAYLVGFASIAASDRDQRVGDRAAGTVVVREADRHGGDAERSPSQDAADAHRREARRA